MQESKQEVTKVVIIFTMGTELFVFKVIALFKSINLNIKAL